MADDDPLKNVAAVGISAEVTRSGSIRGAKNARIKGQ